jgi:hypothetical protein
MAIAQRLASSDAGRLAEINEVVGRMQSRLVGDERVTFDKALAAQVTPSELVQPRLDRLRRLDLRRIVRNVGIGRGVQKLGRRLGGRRGTGVADLAIASATRPLEVILGLVAGVRRRLPVVRAGRVAWARRALRKSWRSSCYVTSCRFCAGTPVDRGSSPATGSCSPR